MSLQKGLVGFWPLDRESLQSATTFADKTPRENVATKYGSVLKFDGGDSNYVEVTDNASLNFGTGDFSISAWVKTSNAIDYAWIIDKETTKFSLGQNNNGCLRAHVNGVVQIGATSIGDNNWHLVSFIRDSGTGSFYIDGVLDGTPITQDGNVDSATSLYLGQWSTGVDNFDGSIGDTRIYSRALTPAEVLTMYQGGVVSDTDLEAHYKFGDKSGTTLTDETANNNDGTLTNFADTTAEYGNTHISGWVTDDTPNVFALDRMGH